MIGEQDEQLSQGVKVFDIRHHSQGLHQSLNDGLAFEHGSIHTRRSGKPAAGNHGLNDFPRSRKRLPFE
jgi:hypothetical protein